MTNGTTRIALPVIMLLAGCGERSSPDAAPNAAASTEATNGAAHELPPLGMLRVTPIETESDRQAALATLATLRDASFRFESAGDKTYFCVRRDLWKDGALAESRGRSKSPIDVPYSQDLTFCVHDVPTSPGPRVNVLYGRPRASGSKTLETWNRTNHGIYLDGLTPENVEVVFLERPVEGVATDPIPIMAIFADAGPRPPASSVLDAARAAPAALVISVYME